MAMLTLAIILLLSCGMVLSECNKCKCQETHSDIYGPYYYPNPPLLKRFCNYKLDKNAKNSGLRRIRIYGRVFANDCKTTLPKVKVEMWQADHAGKYINSSNCRGYVETDKTGFYVFSTVFPGKYTVSEYSRDYRPAHLHFKFNGKNGHKTLVTQMYFDGDEHLAANDACESCSSKYNDLVVKLRKRCRKGKNSKNICWEQGEFNVTLSKGKGIHVSTVENEKDLILC